MNDAPKARDTESAPPSVDYSTMSASEAAVMIRLDDIGRQLKGIGDTLFADHEWKQRVTNLLVVQGKALESILRKRGEDAEADVLRERRVGLLPPYTDEDSETTQPGAQ